MKNKYIHIEDVRKAIYKDLDFIGSFEKEIEHLRKRVSYLSCLEDYLYDDGLCPFSKKELLENDIELQHYVMPLLARKSIIDRDTIFKYKNCFNNESKEISKDNIGALLEDFINFCVKEKKGQKFGVGHYHIQKYLLSRKFV